MPTKVCPQCGKEFKREYFPQNKSGVHCCSRKCSQAAYQARTLKKLDRFWDFVEKTDGCWLWRGKLHNAGYGKMRVGPLTVLAHRYAWELLKGPIPKGLNVCHDCPTGDNPLCCNPAHMFLGTQEDNMRDAARKSKTSFGENSGMAKLTVAQVREIRVRLADGETHKSIAHSYGVTRENITCIRRGKNWSWLL